MNYCGLIKNDFAAAPGASVTLFVSGCEFHCPGCHNPEAQDFNYGNKYTSTTTQEIINALQANGIKRNLCIMGGEPLNPKNRKGVMALIVDIRTVLPDISIYLWTGYTYAQLQNEIDNDYSLEYILSHINYLIDGPYIAAERDITLWMRGSRNQHILKLNKGQIIDIIA